MIWVLDLLLLFCQNPTGNVVFNFENYGVVIGYAKVSNSLLIIGVFDCYIRELDTFGRNVESLLGNLISWVLFQMRCIFTDAHLWV